MKKLLAVIALAWCVSTMAAGEELSGSLTVFHAGSLSVPMKQIAAQFMKIHPNMDIRLEAAGSRECARKITELKRYCDVLVSADCEVIEQLLIPDYATWNIPFATNEMAILYTDKSRRQAEISDKNWFDVLLDDRIAFGRSDPNSDPSGYRAVLCMKLAEKHYDRPGLAADLLAKDTRFLRPKSTDLLALLESGSIDYLISYRSLAGQYGLKCLILPNQINLKDTACLPLYQSVSVTLTGRKPGDTIEQRGEVSVYGLTIPTQAPNPAAATAFVQFFLRADAGMAIIEKYGQPSALPSQTSTYDRIPQPLREFVRKPVASKDSN